MAVKCLSIFLFLGIFIEINGRPRSAYEQLMIDDFLPALLERLQSNPEYAYLLESDVPLPPSNQQISPLLQDQKWPKLNNLGQVAGVAVEDNGDVLVFHRGDRAWGVGTFNYNNQLSTAEKAKGPIKTNTILRLDQNGTKIQELGANSFYMPHGLTVDKDRNLWVTDVGLHQVMKIPHGSENATLVLGVKMEPGDDNKHFCKPTDVAVASNGDFFVSDGYCNGRIMKFDKDGNLKKQWGKMSTAPVEYSKPDELFVPHSLTLLERDDLICVADREHGRIQCFTAGIKNDADVGRFVASISDPRLGRVFAISYDPTNNQMYIVNGPTGNNDVKGFTADLNNNGVVQKKAWGPVKGEGFNEPHDVAVSPDGKHVYVAEIRPNRLTKFNK